MKSNLQIISGKYRGKKLFLPNDARPTQNMARVAIFNILNGIMDMSGEFYVWDAFAGSGAFGLECLSRFSNPIVVFTDISNDSINTIQKNLISVNEHATVEKTDAVSGIARFGGLANLIFLDPPYADFVFGLLFVKKLSKVAKSGTILIWEFESNQETPKIGEDWAVLKDKTYGRARFMFLMKK